MAALADKHPQLVSKLLPDRLDALKRVDQACLSDTLAYAWWHCGKHIPECKDRLHLLAIPQLEELPEKYHPLALRGAATAQLASIAFEVAPAHQIPLLYSSGDRMLYFVDATDLAQEYAPSFVRHTGYDQLQALLVRCINSVAQDRVHPVEQWLYQETYHCARLALELLLRFAYALDDPLPLLRSLPHDWQALRAAWRLLKAGRREQPIIGFAREEYDAHKDSRSIQADHDMHICLLQLACLESDPQQLLEQHKPKRSFLFRTSAEAQNLVLLTDTNPTELLTLLNTTIKNDDSVTVLLDWERETRSWRSLLIARVYARMFSSSSISVPEAQQLCQQMLAGVASLPTSPLSQEYQIVYSTIHDWLRGRTPIPVPVKPCGSPVQQSHSVALSLFPLTLEKRTDSASPEWIDDVFSDRQGWLELDDYKYEDGNIAASFPGYLIYFYPAVRLALVSIGKHYKLPDPAGGFMQRRVESNRIIDDHSTVFRAPLTSDKRLLGRALRDLQRRVTTVPEDERLWERCGNLLLRLGRLEEAEEALKRSLSLRLCDSELRASALYDLACVYARTGMEEECLAALEDSSQVRPLNKDWMQKDPDLESVRERGWFKSRTERPGS